MRDLNKRDWLLILLAYQGAPDGLDPVRIQQALFLFAETSNVAPDARYVFKPGPYGPVSGTLYRHLGTLCAEGLLEARPLEHRSWPQYRATDAGRAIAQHLLQRLGDDHAAARQSATALFDIKAQVASASFDQLLRRIEREYPEATSESVFAHAHHS